MGKLMSGNLKFESEDKLKEFLTENKVDYATWGDQEVPVTVEQLQEENSSKMVTLGKDDSGVHRNLRFLHIIVVHADKKHFLINQDTHTGEEKTDIEYSLITQLNFKDEIRTQAGHSLMD